MKLNVMWKYKSLVIGFVLLFLIGCQSSEILTPTPFPPTSDSVALGQIVSSITPVPAVLSDMMANPEFYEGAHVQVSGQYFRKPIQVCGIDPHPSPAGWDLVAGEVSVPAGGFDDQLRQLLPDGLALTVIGRLTQWKGPIGCGKQAIPTEMWYLDVVKLVNPAQLARVTLTPGGDPVFDGDVAESLFTPISESSEPPPIEDDVLPTSPPVAPPTNTAQPTRVPIETLGAGFTPVATDDISVATPTPSGEGTAVSTEEGTAVPDETRQSTPSGPSTITNTPPPGSTSTPTASLATATIDAGSVLGKGVAFLDDKYFEVTDLDQNNIHEWTLSLDEDDELVLAVIGESNMDMAIKILDENSAVLASQNGNSSGQSETISFNPPETSDFYKIQVSEAEGREGGYLLTGNFEEPLWLPQGKLSYGIGGSSTIEDFEDHVWFFKGEQDDMVDLAISCEPNAELLVILYDSEGDDIAEQFFDEQIKDALLLETDWYIVEIGLWDESISTCTYNLIVTN